MTPDRRPTAPRAAPRAAALKAALALCAALASAVHPAAAAREPKAPVALQPPAEVSPPAVFVDVRDPAKVRAVLLKNRWLHEQLERPLGQGFLGSWSAFFGSRGEDLRAAFKGALGATALRALFEQPFRIGWWTASDRTSSPALIVPAPGDGLRLAFAAVDQVARAGSNSASCPNEPGAPGFLIARWSLAEHTLYAAQRPERIVFARHPAAALQGFCGATSIEAKGPALTLSVVPDRISRGAQVAASLSGLAGPLRLDFDVAGERLVAAGLSGDVARPERLASGAASPELLKLIPATAPIALSVRLQLPEQLDVASLKAFWASGTGQPLRRDATLVWWPRGERAPFEVALLWSREQDRAALQAIFAGKNKLSAEALCGHAALASSEQVLERLRRACAGREPAFKDLDGATVAGLKGESSLSLAVQPGRALSGLLLDGFWSDLEVPKDAPRGAPPKEIEEAVRALNALPVFGFGGTAQGKALVARGFGS